ncbi:MAG TPA: peroxiredoxin-like family protein [Puia sp.]|jgi:peroxiredoxin|nr:peroxiredoxin-like family protein [Puia sp.]
MSLIKKVFFPAMLLATWASAEAQVGPQGLKTNTAAPDFTATDQNGATFHLKSSLAKGSVLLVFYRGQWCPFCNKELKSLEDSLTLITQKGATLVAVTPELQENVSKTIAKTGATYPILHDEGLKIMKSYDVAYAVDSTWTARYLKFGVDVARNNGSNGNNLPVPAIYIIDRKGIIVYRFFEPDFRIRPSVAEIFGHLPK